jgi:hypothetical protein
VQSLSQQQAHAIKHRYAAELDAKVRFDPQPSTDHCASPWEGRVVTRMLGAKANTKSTKKKLLRPRGEALQSDLCHLDQMFGRFDKRCALERFRATLPAH